MKNNIFKNINTAIQAAKTQSYRSVKNDKLIKLLSTKYSNALECYKNECVMFRANKDIGISAIITPRHRTSAGTDNVYTLLISEILPSWKNWPKRNNSLIFSLSYDEASRYTDWFTEYNKPNATIEQRQLYNVFPNNDAMVAVCPYEDMWSSFKYLTKKLGVGVSSIGPNLASAISAAVYIIRERASIKIPNELIATTNPNNILALFENDDIITILKLFKFVDTNFKKPTIDANAISTYMKAFQQNGVRFTKIVISDNFAKSYANSLLNNIPTITFLDNHMNPTINGFKLVPTLNVMDHINSGFNNELYTEGSCLLISTDYIADNNDLLKFIDSDELRSIAGVSEDETDI